MNEPPGPATQALPEAASVKPLADEMRSMTVFSTQPALELDNVTLTYADADVPALRDVNIHVAAGDLVSAIGRTGSGKSSLLGLLTGLVPYFSGGHVSGTVRIAGRDLAHHRPRDLADVVGRVGQDPSAGFVTDTVEEELAYGMEQLGLAPAVMRRRVEETLDVLGIDELRDAGLFELSGGQQQRVAIGSVLVTHPQILVLDEPTSALDPTAAEDVLGTLTRLTQDVGVTVIVAEHRIERVLPFADQVIHVGAGGVVTSGAPADVLRTSDVAPPIIELGRELNWTPLPLTIRDARRRLAADHAHVKETSPSVTAHTTATKTLALSASGIRVKRGGRDVVKGVDLTAAAGTITALMGRNGCGKSTLLWALQGSGERDGGTLTVGLHAQDPAALSPSPRRALVGLVPQTASDLLYLDSVAAELAQADQDAHAAAGTARALLDELAPGIADDMHPRDLSEGQKLALVLAIQLAAAPPVLLLDEPTRGLDYAGKAALRAALTARANAGCAIIVATHDVEFAATCADRVIAMAQGDVIADGPVADVLLASPALAPQVAKIMAPVPALTVADAVKALRG